MRRKKPRSKTVMRKATVIVMRATHWSCGQ